LELAEQYQRKLWCSDALLELERALQAEPELRGDQEMARIANACMGPKTRDKAQRLLDELKR
jgi:hypothetical protein